MTEAARNNSKHIDRIVAGAIVSTLLYSTWLLLRAHFEGANLGDWIWDRHQNQFSWYSRPLFIVPACYYAYRRKIWHVIGFMLLLGTSLFWFAAPENVPDSVRRYLEWEKQLFFANQSPVPLILLTTAVVAFLFGLFYAFWNRNGWYGLLLINIGTIIKIIVSIWFGEETGMAAIVPSLSSLAIINSIALAVWMKFRKKPT